MKGERMAILTLKEIQNIELQILLQFKKTCEKWDLRFYLCGGTMLGAARHNGFIPWDDDVDVMMPRPDYMKLIRLEKEKKIFSDELKLYSSETGNSDYPFAKLAYVKSHIVNQYMEDDSVEHLFIDIMPVDGLPTDDLKVKKIYRKANYYRRLLMLCAAKYGEGTTLVRKMSKYVMIPFARLFGSRYWCRKLDSLSKNCNYDTAEHVGIISWGLYGTGERVAKDAFEKKVTVLFEGNNMPAMSCWDAYLRGLYGDYMQLPPENKRRVHMVQATLD